jgi:hypothetical protein
MLARLEGVVRARTTIEIECVAELAAAVLRAAYAGSRSVTGRGEWTRPTDNRSP